MKIRISSAEERACHSYADEVCFYKADFVSGLYFPVHPFVRELFSYLHLALSQLVPNFWHILVSCMVVWMLANDGDVIRRDEFLHFYHLRKSRDPVYYEFKPWDRASRLILDYPRLSKTGSQIFVLSLEVVGSSSLLRTWMKPPSFFVVGEFTCLMRLSHLFSCFSILLRVTMIDDLFVFLFCSCLVSLSKEEAPTSR